MAERKHYHTGHNQPGSVPDERPGTHATRHEAKAEMVALLEWAAAWRRTEAEALRDADPAEAAQDSAEAEALALAVAGLGAEHLLGAQAPLGGAATGSWAAIAGGTLWWVVECDGGPTCAVRLAGRSAALR